MLKIYVLKCYDNKYYVGKTRKNVDERFLEHLCNDNSCSFTMKHKPMKIIDHYETNDPLDEDKTTKKYMMEYGIDNVRGGSYTKLELEDWQIKSLNHEFVSTNDLCYKCKLSGHFAKDCGNNEIVNYINEIDNEIKKIKKIYDQIVLLTTQINDSKYVDHSMIEEIKKCAADEKIKKELMIERELVTKKIKLLRQDIRIDRQEKQYMISKINEELGIVSRKISGIPSNDWIISKINDIHRKIFIGDKPSCYGYKNISILNFYDCDVKALEIINYNIDKKIQLNNILAEYKNKEYIKNVLIGLYEKRYNLLNNYKFKLK